MNHYIDVFTGEVKIAGKGNQLVSHAIGSCIVVTAYDPDRFIGAMAHIMLPGKAPEQHCNVPFKYAANAIKELLRLLDVSKVKRAKIICCLVGGGNVLRRKNDSICCNNIKSVLELLDKNNLKIASRSVGGIKRRSIRFNVDNGDVIITENGSKEILLWSFLQGARHV